MYSPLRLIVALCACAALAACGSRQPVPPAQLDSGASFIRAQIAQLGTLATPQGVDDALWRGLTSALRDALQARLDSGRTALTAPASNLSQAQLTLNEGTQTLSWAYASQGDFDQNGEVNVADLAPLAAHFHNSTNGAGPFSASSVQSVIDGDNNGEINLGDIAAISQNLGNSVVSYTIYTSADAADLPGSNSGPNGPGAVLLGNVAQSTGIGNPKQARLTYTFGSGVIGPTAVFWVRPNDALNGAGSDGTPSTGAGPGAPPSGSTTISGTILTEAGVPLSGVMVALSGGSALQTTSAADGTYSIANVPAGNVTVTPTLTDIAFTPASTALNVGTDASTGLNFSAALNINLTPYDFHLDLGSGPNEVAHFAKGTSIDCYVEPGNGVAGWQASFDDDIKAAVLDWNVVGVPWGLFTIRLTNNKDDAEMYFHWVTTLGGQTVGRANIAVTSPPPTITLPYDVQMATGTIDGPVNDTVVRMTTVHELGHALGLWQHSDQDTDIMFPSVGGFELPSRRDIWTMYTLYNTAPTFSSTGRGPASLGRPQWTYKTHMD